MPTGSTPLVIATTYANGVAEDLFFQGALYAAVDRRHPVAKSTAAYVVATASMRTPRSSSPVSSWVSCSGCSVGPWGGGVEASALTHLTWPVLMLRYLPQLFRRPKTVR